MQLAISSSLSFYATCYLFFSLSVPFSVYLHSVPVWLSLKSNLFFLSLYLPRTGLGNCFYCYISFYATCCLFLCLTSVRLYLSIFVSSSLLDWPRRLEVKTVLEKSAYCYLHDTQNAFSHQRFYSFFLCLPFYILSLSLRFESPRCTKKRKKKKSRLIFIYLSIYLFLSLLTTPAVAVCIDNTYASFNTGYLSNIFIVMTSIAQW